MKCTVLIFLLLGLAPFEAGAKKLYTYRDNQGVLHFTDKPPKNGAQVTVRQLKPAPRQMVRLIESGGGRHPRYAFRNDYEGPVEIEADFSEAKNARATPELPGRFTVHPGVSDPLLEMSAIDESEDWGFSLGFRYVPGKPLPAYRSGEPYLPPFAPDAAFRVTQAFGGAFSHQDDQNRYAVDIAMPEGTPVHAARAGVVMDVENDFFEGGVNKAYSTEANNIRILHDDGSMAVYAHMELEKAQVYPGLQVAAGQLIGYSGNTGYSSGPHLHFAVQYNRGMKLVSSPFSFLTPEGQEQEPAEGALLTGIKPKPDLR